MEIDGISFNPADVVNTWSDYKLDGNYEVTILLKNKMTITKTVNNKKVADDILDEVKRAKPIRITTDVFIEGDTLRTSEYSIGLEKINALYDDDFTTYLLTDNERRPVTSTLNSIDGKMAKVVIAPHVAQLTEINGVFVNKDRLTDFYVGAKSNGKGYFVYTAIGKYILPVSFGENFITALDSYFELCKKYKVAK